MPLDLSHQQFLCVSLYTSAFAVMGAGMAALGPSVDEFERQINADLGKVGLIFSGRGAGYLLGALAAGWQLKHRPELSHRALSIVCFMSGVGLLAMPRITSLPLLILAAASCGVTEGYNDTAVNLLLVWCVMDRMERFLHMVHAGFAIGALIGPVVVREIGFNIGFTFLGLFAIATSIAAMFVLQPGKPSDETAPAVDKEEREERSTVQWVLALLIAAHLYLYIGMEEGYGAVIYSMASEDYGGNLSHHESTGIDTIFWAAMAVGRTAAGPLSVRYNLRGSRMLMLAASGMVVASSLHAAVPNTRFALWFGSALMGLSQAPVFPASIATLEYAYPITPTITTFMVMFAAAGSISVPPLLLYVYSERENTGLMGVIFMIFSISSLTLINAFTCVEKKMRSNLLTITSETLSQYKVQADEALDEEAKDDNSFHPPREVRV
ncbi:Glucose/mannose transporter GlcP [Diplonema papillatum]|nr:Glucose/mannose transporter GlcP [Diplonema papillatum]